MKRLSGYFSIITVALLCLFVFGCEESATATSSPVKEKAKPAVTERQRGEPISQPERLEKAVKGQKTGPSIEFEKKIHNFGDVTPGSWNICEFKFKNTGDEVLKLGNIKASCGCTAATLVKDEYDPGEEGVVRVKYHGDQQLGPKSRHLYVPTNDRNKPRVIITVDANIIYKVAYEPRKLDLLLDQENAGCPAVTLKSVDGKPFSIKAIHSSKNCITAEFDPTIEATKFVLKPKVNMDVLNKHLRGEVDFKLSHPECKVIKIAYRAKPFFRFRPASAVVFDVSPQEPVKKEVTLSSNYDMDFEIDSTNTKKGFIKVLDMERIDKHYKLVLEISSPDSSKGKKPFTDMLTVVMKDGKQVKLPCRGFYKKSND